MTKQATDNAAAGSIEHQSSRVGDVGIQHASVQGFEGTGLQNLTKDQNAASSMDSQRMANNGTVGKVELFNDSNPKVSAYETDLRSAGSVQKDFPQLSVPFTESAMQSLLKHGNHSGDSHNGDATPRAPESHSNANHNFSRSAATHAPAPVLRPASVRRPSW